MARREKHQGPQVQFEPFEAAAIKISRSKRHLDELVSSIKDFFERDGPRVVLEMAEELNKNKNLDLRAFTYRQGRPIPKEWSAIVGDVIHNLRASLDLMATDIFRIAKGNPQEIEYVYYPFCRGKDYLHRTIKDRRLGRIGQHYKDVIEQTAPYDGGNVGLRALHDLDILDKHQSLLPTLTIASVDWPVIVKSGSQQITVGVAKDGHRIMYLPEFLCKVPLGSEVPATFGVVFGDVKTFAGSDLVQQLERCVNGVENILQLFVEAYRQNEGKVEMEVPKVSVSPA